MTQSLAGFSDIMRTVAFLVLVFALTWPVSELRGQTRTTSQQAQTARFRLADTYMRAGQYERAVSLLEDLYAENPRSTVFFDKLKTAYVGLKRYDDAIRLVDEWISLGPTPQLYAERGSLEYQNGNEEAAHRSWERAVEIAPNDHRAYRAVYFMMSANRLFDDAVAMLEEGRRRLRNEHLFQLDLANMYGLLGRYDLAMAEYARAVSENPNQLSYVKRQLGQITDRDSLFSLGLTAIERAVRQNPLNRALRELAGWTYFEAGQYQRSLEAYAAIDRLESEEGRVLFAFARNAADAGTFETAKAALEDILARYEDGLVAPLALFELAEINERQGIDAGEQAMDPAGNRNPAPHFEEALARYKRFLSAYPEHPLYPEALQRVGDLQRSVFFDLRAAESTLDEVSRRFGTTESAALARYNLGEIALERGDLAGARLIFSRLAEELEIGELAERCRFETARIDYYRGHFEMALATVAALDANTSTDISNDAIALKLLLRENKGPDSLNTPLRNYARAELALRRRQPHSALQLLDSLQSTIGTHPISDEVLFTRAQANRQLGQYEEAISLLQVLPDRHPGSYLEDRALFTIGEIYERELGNDRAALESYNEVLFRFPASLLSPEVRTRIRNLRGDEL